MEKVKQIVVTNIKWDAPKSVKLPKQVIIDIDEDNEYLLEDLDYNSDELCNYLSDEYGYCIYNFCFECE